VSKTFEKLGGGLDYKGKIPVTGVVLGFEKKRGQVYGLDGTKPDIDLRNLVKRGIYQDGTQVCVAVDFMQQLYMRSTYLIRQGLSSAEPCEASIPGHYRLARARKAGKASKAKGWRPIDVGCSIHDLWMAAQEVGIMPASSWPFDPAKVDDKGPLAAYQKAGTRDWLKWRYVAPVEDAIRGALVSNYGVGLPLPVDQGLIDWTFDKPPWRFEGALKGYHMVTACGATKEGILFHTAWRDWNRGSVFGLCDWSMLNHEMTGLPVMLLPQDDFLKAWRAK